MLRGGVMLIYPLLIIGLLTSKIKTSTSTPFSKADTNGLKGLFAILIFLHHISYKFNAFDDMPALSLIFNDIGSIGVGVFFFISGYGLMISSRKPDYTKNLLCKKIPKLYLLHVLINILYIFADIIRGVSYDFITFLTAGLGLDMFNNFVRANGNSWYITSILIIYFIFAITKLYCTKNNTKEKTFFILFSLFTILVFGIFLLAFSYNFNEVSIYIRAIYCLFFGMIYFYFSPKINKFLSKYFWYIIGLIVVAIVLLLDIQMSYSEGQVLFTIIKEFLLPVLVMIFILTLNQKITLDSPVLNFLGDISLEIYLLHGLIQELLFGVINNQFLFTLTSLVLVIILSTIINKIYTKLSNKLTKKN